MIGSINGCLLECFEPRTKIVKTGYSICMSWCSTAFRAYDSSSFSSIKQRSHVSSREAAVDIGSFSGSNFIE